MPRSALAREAIPIVASDAVATSETRDAAMRVDHERIVRDVPSAIDTTLAAFERIHREARLEAILASGLASTLKAARPRAALGLLALKATSDSVSRSSLDLLGRILASARTWPALSPIAWDKSLVDPAVLERVLAHEVALAIPRSDAAGYRFWLTPWAAREADQLPEDQLARVAAHPWLGAALVASMLPGADRKRLGPTLDRAARIADAKGSTTEPSTSAANKRRAESGPVGIERVFAGIDAHAARIAASGTLDVFIHADSSDPAPGELWLHAIARRSVVARCPRVIESIRAITPARLLRNALHAEELVPDATDADAQLLVDLATAPVREADTVMSYGTMQAVLVARAPVPSAPSPELEAAIEALVGVSTSNATAAVKTSAAKTSAAKTSAAKTSAAKTSAAKTSAAKTSAAKTSAAKTSAAKTSAARPPSAKTGAAKTFAAKTSAAKLPSAKTGAAKTFAARTSAAKTTAAAKATHAAARIAELASTAALLVPAIARLHARLALVADSDRLAGSSHEATYVHDEDFPSIAHLLDHSMPWWTLDAGIEMPQQLLDAGRYLVAPSSIEPRAFATPAPSEFPWELLITRVGELMYRLLAPATMKARRREFAGMLQRWLHSGLARHAKALRGADLVLPESMIAGMDRRFSTRLVTWGDNRYFVRFFRLLEGARAGVRVLEHAHDGVFRVPEGGQLGEHVMADARFDEAAIQRTLELYETRGPVPFDARIGAMIASRTGLSPAAATLVWTAGYEPWLLGEKKRAEYGLERDALDTAERELARPRLREIYVTAMPADPAQMYEPEILAERVAEAWRVYRAELLALEAQRTAPN